MKEEIKEILENLKDSVENPVFIELDGFTEEAYEVLNFFALDPTNGSCKALLEYIENLQSQLKAKEEVIKEALDKIETLRMEKWAIMGTDIIDILKILSKGENK
jgi:hypothetical protein